MKPVFFTLAMLAACGGSAQQPPGTNVDSASLSGNVAGNTFSVASEFAPVGRLVNTGKPDGQSIAIFLSNTPGALSCLVAQQQAAGQTPRTSYADEDELQLGVFNELGDVTTGTYTLGAQTAGTGAEAVFTTTTSTCGDGANATATGGSITITAISPSVKGTYDVTFGAFGSFSGAFDVTLCQIAIEPATFDAGPVTCKP